MQVPPLPPAWTPGEPIPPEAAPSGAAEAPRSGARRAAGSDVAGLACLRELSRLGVSHQVAGATRGVATPVRITGPLNGLRLAGGHSPRAGALMDCRFALAIHRFAPLALRAGFDTLVYSSAYRYTYVAGTRSLSRHASGLALDVHELRGPGGLVANVKRDWVRAAAGPASCVGNVTEDKARRMRQLVCDLEASGLISMVLTPESNYAHRDHLHISGLTPGERPRRHRWCGGHASPAAAPVPPPPPPRPVSPGDPPPPPDPDSETN
jgi:hypothetical protein